MNFDIQLQRDLESELRQCQSRYALLQEMANIATSEMTDLEKREQAVSSALQRLHEAQALFSPDSTRLQYQDEYYYTPESGDLQEQSTTDFVESRELVQTMSSVANATQSTLWPE
jgi:hypothetical protein